MCFFNVGAEVALVGGLKLLARLSLLTEQDLWTVNGLPNENNSSDHLPLLAKFSQALKSSEASHMPLRDTVSKAMFLR